MPIRPSRDGGVPDLGGLDIKVIPGDRATVIELRGEVDVVSVPSLRERLQELAVEGQVNQVLDLAAVTFLDSAGLGAIVSARRRLRVLQGALALAGADDRILRLLRLTSMDRVLPVHPTVAEAIEAEFPSRSRR